MKLLELRVSGFKLLNDGFKLDFLTKSRVNQYDLEDEVLELAKGLTINTSTVLAGKNSSGKSTVVSLLNMIYELTGTGRIKYDPLYFRDKKIDLEIYLFEDDDPSDNIYRYNVSLVKPTNVFSDATYLIFEQELLEIATYYKSYGKKIHSLDYMELDAFYTDVNDTSVFYKYIELFGEEENFHRMSSIINSEYMYWITISSWMEYISKDFYSKIVSMFDESIQSLEYNFRKETYRLKREGFDPIDIEEDEISNVLSRGTVKGVALFLNAINVLVKGGTLIIDEIENSFHKNLVENIILIFQDKRTNPRNANLIFTTHYVEILDIYRRRDNVFIMEKEKYIKAKNLYSDFTSRSELLKSNQFNSNMYKTLVNYDKLMTVKKGIINEVLNTTRR